MPTPFQQAVFALVKTIPKGATMTYAAVAKAIGRPKAVRAVGNALNTNYDPAIPCHRVVRSDGTPGGYNRGTAAKKTILKQEKLQTKMTLHS